MHLALRLHVGQWLVTGSDSVPKSLNLTDSLLPHPPGPYLRQPSLLISGNLRCVRKVCLEARDMLDSPDRNPLDDPYHQRCAYVRKCACNLFFPHARTPPVLSSLPPCHPRLPSSVSRLLRPLIYHTHTPSCYKVLIQLPPRYVPSCPSVTPASIVMQSANPTSCALSALQPR